MTKSSKTQETTENYGVRFKQFREAFSQQHGYSFSEFFKEIGIMKQRYLDYEKCNLWPDFIDLQRIGLNTGVNLNWLVYRNGSMFGAREKDMEEMIQKIEADENGRYADYKMLLKLMQVKGMEDLIFGMQSVFLNFLSTSDFVSKLKEPEEVKEMLPEIRLPEEEQ